MRVSGWGAANGLALIALLACGSGCAQAQLPPGGHPADGGSGAADDHGAPDGSVQGGTVDATADAGTPTSDGGSACDPLPEAGSLYAVSDKRLGDLEPVSMCAYRGKVLFIFNAAQLCGFTFQTTNIQGLQETYASQGLAVLGFYSNDFANQGGDPAVCNANYHVTFDTFDLAPVTPPNARPVFAWIEAQTNPGPAPKLPPEWNFSKYLVSRRGELVAHWPHATAPNDPAITTAIEAELAKP